MTTEALGIDTVERLSRLDRRGHAVLTVFLDLDPARFPTPAARDTQLGALFDRARREGARDDVDRVAALLHSEPTITRGARALAIFCSVEADILEVVRLPRPVEPMAVVDTVPWLEPLAAMISPGDWGVAVVSRNAARLFRGDANALTEFATIADEVHGRHAQGGWSQANYQRGIEEEVALHVRRVAERLLRAHTGRPFEHVVIVASGELRPVVEHSLHGTLTAVLAGAVDADLEHASADEIGRAVAPVIEHAEGERETALIARIAESLGTGGPAAAGLDEVLSTLEQHRVAVLLVPQQSELEAGLCPRCGRLSSIDGGKCPLDGADLDFVNAVEHAVEKATSDSAQVVVMRHDVDCLTTHGGIAALLRW